MAVREKTLRHLERGVSDLAREDFRPEVRQDRLRVVRLFWITVGLIALSLFARDLFLTKFDGDMTIIGGALWGRDFANVYSAGSLLLDGRLDILYDVPAYRAYQVELFDQGLRLHNYSYPPATLLYAWLFALLPYPVALIVWIAGTGILFAFAARPYLGQVGLDGWVALVAPASIINVWAGHYGFLIGALWLLAWHHLPRRPMLAGILIGLMIVKPHLAALAPVVLAWRREWSAIAAAAATVAAIGGLSALIFGSDLWVTYLSETARMQAAMVDDFGTFHITMMSTVMPSMIQLGIPRSMAIAVQIGVALGAIALLLRYLPRDSEAAGLATATATFLVLPYAFAYDMTVVGLAALILFYRSLGHRSEAYRMAYCLAAVLPMLVSYLNFFRIALAPFVLAFALLAMLGALRAEGGIGLRNSAAI